MMQMFWKNCKKNYNAVIQEKYIKNIVKALIILIYFGAFIEILHNRKIIKDGEKI